jgi:thiamine-phosphate pyrophosphorylase
MNLKLSEPILYLITRGATTESTTPSSVAFTKILDQVRSAVASGIQLIQIREKHLTARVLSELTERAVEITHGSRTKLLVNDRADIAAGAGADGVHLTAQSLPARVVRDSFGDEFLIGASTHSIAEASTARDGSADFAVLGPIFETQSKAKYGPPLGLEMLATICAALKPFPILALGGISQANAVDCLNAGASGVAGISLFSDADHLGATVASIFKNQSEGREADHDVQK